MKYDRCVRVYLPKTLAREFERAVIDDGRRASEIVRTLIVGFIRRKNGWPAHGPTHGPTLGPTR